MAIMLLNRLLPLFLLTLVLLPAPPARAVELLNTLALPEQTMGANPAERGASAAMRFNALNTSIRDGKIDRETARSRLEALLGQLHEEYATKGGGVYKRQSWVFPLAGYTARAIGNGRVTGYVASGYDFFKGNRHGGHPSFDMFIHDRNQDCRDDRSGKPVKVLSLTGGIVVALEREWAANSALRGGKYVMVYDPVNELLVYYAHNSELFVQLGDMVKPGDLLAQVGRSGLNAARRRSPTHLHLTVLHVKHGVPLPVNVYPELQNARLAAAD